MRGSFSFRIAFITLPAALIEEDQIVATVMITTDTPFGSCDIYLINPAGRSVRLRSGCFISP